MDMLDLGNRRSPGFALPKVSGEAARADTLEGLADLLRASLRAPGPFLIELEI